MLKNYLKILFRDLKRNKSYTFINIGGLAAGLACCILIALYVRSELSHDDAYKYADQIVILGYDFSSFGKSISTPYPLASALEAEVPMVESSVRTFWPGSGEVSLDGQEYFEEESVFHAGEDFFTIFTFPFTKGAQKNALDEPNTAVISAELAQKLFPGENPLGRVIHVKERGNHTYRITGVAKSRETSYFDFNVVLSMSTLDYAESHGGAWHASMWTTAALLSEGSNIERFNEQLTALSKRHLGEKAKSYYFAEKFSGFYLSDLSRSDGFHGKWLYIYLFGSVALFILLLACVNYINLATARAAKRAREVGVRKTAGASRTQIIRQFIGESVLMSGAAFLIGLFLASLALPFFNHLFEMNLTFAEAGFDWFLILAAITLGVGFLSGCYPAFYLSSFKPTRILKGYINQGRSKNRLRKGLVTLQFVVAAVLIISTVVVFRQLHFTQQKDLGFEGEQVVVTAIPGDAAIPFRREVEALPDVLSVTVTNGVPGDFSMTLGLKPQTVSQKAKADTSQMIRFRPAVVDYQYFETLGLQLAAGRQFLRERSSDKNLAYIINENAAEAMGWTPQEAIGKPFSLREPGKVIGVVKDFHIASLHRSIGPVVLQLHEAKSWSASKEIAIRLAPGAIQTGLQYIKEVQSTFTNEPFIYSFLDDEFAKMYREERRLGQIFGVFAGIAVLLACMGLFGLATFAAERRTKEIGIRKVLGATVSNIVGLLSKDFLKLALFGFVIAVPIAWYFMNKWLADFAYKIDIGIGIFLLAGGLALLIALATVSWQSVRAALANPVDSLRSE